MSARLRLLGALCGLKVDRTSFAPLVNEYFLSALPEDYPCRDPVSFLRSVGADVALRWVDSYDGLGFGLEYGDVTETAARKERRVSPDQVDVEYQTPYGTLTQTKVRLARSGDTWQIRSPLLKSPDDLRAYTHLWENIALRPAYEKTAQVMDALGDDGLIMLRMPATPILQLIMYDMGMEGFHYMLEDEPDAMKSLLQVMTEKCLEACGIAARSPGEVLIVPENSGTMLVSRAQFEAYCAPLFARYAELAHANGKHILLHACGHMDKLTDLVIETGLDGIESLTPPPTGNVPVEHMRRLLEGGLSVWGGLDPTVFAASSPDQAEQSVRVLMDALDWHPRFVLMPADSVAPGTPIENFIRAMDVLREHASS